MTQIIAVSKAGENVLTATDPNDFIFHSAYNTFKIVAEGLLTTQTVNANPTTFTLAHNQSITPAFYAFAKFPDDKVVMSGPLSFDYTGAYDATITGYGQFTPEVNATNLYFIFTRPGSNYNVDIKYYIFESPL